MFPPSRKVQVTAVHPDTGCLHLRFGEALA